MSAGQGWRWFGAWALAGAFVVFAVLAGFSIGLFLLPLAIVGVVLIARRARRWPETLGTLAGAGAVVLLLGAGHARDYEPCPEGTVVLPPGETEWSCGGAAPLPWLISGGILVAVGLAGYALARRRTLGDGIGGLSRGETVAVVLAAVVAVVGITLVATGGTTEERRRGVVIAPPP
jgi:hypothetical protein